MKEKNQNNTIAICYDFDKTLSPEEVSLCYGYFQKIGISEQDFWKEETNLKCYKDMDHVLAYLFFTIYKAKQLNIEISKEDFESFGKNVKYYNGVESWFERINNYAKKQGINVEHYILSAGIKEIMENCSIAKYCKKIYANTYIYDEQNHPIWPAYAINASNKTEYLYRIKKNILKENDRTVNDKVKKYHVPFKNMIYIGDSFTDIPCMSLVYNNGGTSIGVYDDCPVNKDLMLDLFSKNRINNFCIADYSENSEIEKVVKKTIDKIKKESLENKNNLENII